MKEIRVSGNFKSVLHPVFCILHPVCCILYPVYLYPLYPESCNLYPNMEGTHARVPQYFLNQIINEILLFIVKLINIKPA